MKAGSRDVTKHATCFLSVRLETQPVRMLLSKLGGCCVLGTCHGT